MPGPFFALRFKVGLPPKNGGVRLAALPIQEDKYFEETDQPSTAATSHAPPAVERTRLLSRHQAQILHLP
jgi:hypothetical protein